MKKQIKADPLLLPLPVVLVSCGLPDQPPNIITISWTGIVASDPPMLSISVRPNRHSHAIIKQTGQFVVNVPAGDMVKEVDYCGTVSGKDYDKFLRTLLTPVKATEVDCPMIEEAVICLECKVEKTLELGSHEMFIARIVAVHVEEDFLDEKGRIKVGEVKPFAYVPGDKQYWSLGHPNGYFGFSRGSF